MESLAILLTDAALADCIEQLGDHGDDPTREQLTEVLPGLVERHGLAITRIMLASTVAGEAKAAGVIRDLLKNDELVKLPKEEPRRIVPAVEHGEPDRSEREALKARARGRRVKQAEAAVRREQSARDRAATAPSLADRLVPELGLSAGADTELVVEEPRLRLDATAESGELAVRADHPVARHDDRDRVPAVGGADRTRLVHVAEPPGLLAVADGLAVRNRQQRAPRGELERRAVGRERNENS